MADLFINRISKFRQSTFSILIVGCVSVICYAFSSYIDHRVVALILLLAVSLIAVSFDILPVLIAAALSALIWNFFFIPPRFTFHVHSTDDLVLFIMYFVIAMVNAVLTYKIRQIEKIARLREEKANTVKLYNTLLNSLSHELRTPIATIIGATDNLQTNSRNLTPQNKDELIAEISKASFRLNQQVENLLNMSRLESGFVQPKKDWCDINEVVYETVKRVEENNISQKISINIDPDIPLFKLDKGMLEQIIYNLLNNASLYTDPYSIINITATCYTNVLQIIIEDNGRGFPEEEIKNVFDKFYRLRNSKTGGTGLGLSIVKGFTEALGGNVRLENVP
ncbi:MAG: DUF4118 domain-containing protein, partial [Flavisolibacter sp.]|nr:DUF4118 domain-containing protein [Flavisolibacter sp.]